MGALASLLMGVCLAVFLAATPGLNAWLSAAGCLLIDGAAYVGAAYLLRVDELRRVPQLLRRR